MPPSATSPDSRAEEADWSLTLVVAKSLGDLMQHVSAWQDLAGRSVEPNMSYEPTFLVASLDYISAPTPRFLLIYARDRKQRGGAEKLVGFFPFSKSRRSGFGKLSRYQLYTNAYVFLRTPLIDPGFLSAVVDILLDWFASRPDGVRLFSLGTMGADGPVWRALTGQLAERGFPFALTDWHERAVLHRQASAEEVIRSEIKAKKRKELRRQRNRLEQLGRLQIRAFQSGDSFEAWAEQFIALEASGWKRGEPNIFGRNRQQRRFLKQILRESAENGSLLMLSLDLDGQPIAQKCSFRSRGHPATAFAFKIAFDERFARYSPGVQLELENIRYLHDVEPEIVMMDSCASPDHPMIDQLWRARRNIGSLVCAAPDLASRAIFRLSQRYPGRF